MYIFFILIHIVIHIKHIYIYALHPTSICKTTTWGAIPYRFMVAAGGLESGLNTAVKAAPLMIAPRWILSDGMIQAQTLGGVIMGI